jgi:hypothetical protein
MVVTFNLRVLAGNLYGNESWRDLEGTNHQQNIKCCIIFELLFQICN